MSIIYGWKGGGQPTVSSEQLIRRAQDMIPALRDHAEAVNAKRRLSEESLNDLRVSGLARLLQPSRIGGAQASVAAMIDVLIPVASGCPSTAWCLAQYILHNFMLARWAPEAQSQVWHDPNVLISGTVIPKLGRAVRVEDGYLLSGRWPLVSGVEGSDWCLIAAMLESKNAPDEERYFAVPTAHLSIIDTWHSIGLRGSGSQDVELIELAVPEIMSVPATVFRGGDNPGSVANDAALYRMPVFSTLALPHAACLIGIAESMFETFLSQSRRRRSLMTDENPAGYQTHQMAVGQISAALQAGQALLRADAEEMMHSAASGLLPTPLERSNYRCNGAYAGELARGAAHTIWDLVGARGAYADNPIARLYQDMLVASRHITMNLQVNSTEHGRARLRLPLASAVL